MRKRDDTLRGTLLAHAREISGRDGTDALNIRALAKQAGVSVGTVYNYFESKDAILLALTEAYWHNTLRDMCATVQGDSFLGQVEGMYAFLRERIDHTGGTLMNSLHRVKQAGREKMQDMQGILQSILTQWMTVDAGIRQDIWRENFTREQYVEFIMMNLLLLLEVNAPNIVFFLEIMRKTLY